MTSQSIREYRRDVPSEAKRRVDLARTQDRHLIGERRAIQTTERDPSDRGRHSGNRGREYHGHGGRSCDTYVCHGVGVLSHATALVSGDSMQSHRFGEGGSP